MTTALRQRMLQDLQLAGLSEHTQEAYLRAVRQLADHFHTPPDRLTEHQVRDYFLHLKNDRKFASASLVVAYSGIKFFYSHTTPRDWPTLQRLRVRKEKRLPDVLSVDEVRRLIATVRTHQYRAYFWTVYSLGLRLAEGLHLQVGDIDSARMMVHVHRGKGAKDRYVPLPSSTLKILRQYWVTHRHPLWLFPAAVRDGQQTTTADQPLERSSVQGAMRRVVEELKIQKAISIHSLRHNADSRIMPTASRGFGSSGCFQGLSSRPSRRRRGIIRTSSPSEASPLPERRGNVLKRFPPDGSPSCPAAEGGSALEGDAVGRTAGAVPA
jgi:integrase/recombinase XerD